MKRKLMSAALSLAIVVSSICVPIQAEEIVQEVFSDAQQEETLFTEDAFTGAADGQNAGRVTGFNNQEKGSELSDRMPDSADREDEMQDQVPGEVDHIWEDVIEVENLNEEAGSTVDYVEDKIEYSDSDTVLLEVEEKEAGDLFTEQAESENPEIFISSLEEEKKVITGFEKIDSAYIQFSYKPSKEIVMNQLPKAIRVYFDNETVLSEIPVTWETEANYDYSGENYYLFWAKWDETKYELDASYTYESYHPFYEVLINDGLLKAEPQMFSSNGAPLKAETRTLSSGVENIVKRAHQQVDIEWKPVKTVKGYINSKGSLTATYTSGATYHGIPYGQLIDSGKYVPHSASFQTFIDAVNNPESVFYTKRGSYGKLSSTYYGSDCSAFVSYAYGLPRMTTSTIGRSSLFSKVSGNSIYNAQVGDCFNKAGSHVELITGITRDGNGKIISVEVSEQTPPKARTITYSPGKVQSIIDNGYTLLRYSGRDSVPYPDPIPEPPYVDLGPYFDAYILNNSAWKMVSVNNGNVELQAETAHRNQLWYFERQEDGSYRIQSVYDRDCCLDVHDFGGSGTNVKISEDNGYSAQRWYIRGESPNYHLVPVCSPECSLDCEGGGESVGTNIQIYETNGTAAQEFRIWKFDNLPDTPIVTTQGKQYQEGDDITINWGENRFATLYHLKIENTDGIYREFDTSGIEYTLEDVPCGKYDVSVTSVNMNGKATSERYSFYVGIGAFFDAYILNNSAWKMVSVNNGNVELQKETNYRNQLWYFERQDDGSYRIQSVYNRNCCLDVHDFGGSGTNVKIAEDNGYSAQRWYITGKSPNYHLVPVCSPECSLDCEGGGGAVGTNIQIYTTNDTYAQEFRIWKFDNLPDAPTVTTTREKYMEGDDITISWGENAFATLYHITVLKDGVKYQDFDSYAIEHKMKNVPRGVYEMSVTAVNYNGSSKGKSCIVTVTGICTGGHIYDDGSVTIEATCTKEGVRTYTCTVCGEEKTEKIAATGHKITVINATEATATEPGYAAYAGIVRLG